MGLLAWLLWLVPALGTAADGNFPDAGKNTVHAAAPSPPMEPPGYVTIEGDPGSIHRSGKVRLIRGNQVILINLKKLRANPKLDVKLQPGDVLQFPQTFF